MKKSFWKERKVLVTGGTGLLGSELVAQLIKYNADVIAIVRDRPSKSRFFTEKMHDKITVVNGDIQDYFLMDRVVAEYEIDTIFHLAALTIVRVSNMSPLATFNTNIKGTWNVLEAARVHMPKVRSVVVASSDKAYGPAEKLPYDESTELRGKYPYDVSKSCTDLLSQSYFHSYGLPVSITRCGNLFGPGDLNLNRIIPGTIQSVMLKERPIIRSDGKFVRNYFYIKDAVKGYLEISEDMEKTAGEAFNLGTDDRYSVLEITNMILKLMNSKLKPIIKNEAFNEIYEQYLDTSKAKEFIDWRPKYTTRAALKETIAWYEKNL